MPREGQPGGEQGYQESARDEGGQVVEDDADQDGPGAKAVEDPGGLNRRGMTRFAHDALSRLLSFWPFSGRRE
jgi:hypothetical protein